MDTNLTIKSIGWSLSDSVGGFPGKTFPIATDQKPEKSDIFSKPFKNFGRLDDMSKAACTAVAFALRSVDSYPKDEKQPISILFSNPRGSLNSDTEYYKDYIEFGKTAGRANLFLYTLPTSPLGEVSVHFGLTGNIAYFADSENPLKVMIEAAEADCEFRKSVKSSEKQFLLGLGSTSNLSNLRSPSPNSKNNLNPCPSKHDDNTLPGDTCLLRSENEKYVKETAEVIFILVSNTSSGFPGTENILKSFPDFSQLKKIVETLKS